MSYRVGAQVVMGEQFGEDGRRLSGVVVKSGEGGTLVRWKDGTESTVTGGLWVDDTYPRRTEADR